VKRKTKVLLVQPRGVQEGFTRGDTRLPPLGLLYIAAAIRQIAEVRLVDADALGIDNQAVLTSLGDWAPDLVGMTVSALTIETVCRFARKVKETTGARIILGGPLPSADPLEALKHQEVDFAGVGDGESIMQGLCLALEESRDPGTVQGVVSKTNSTNETWKNNPARVRLSTVERPAWDMLPDFSSYRSPDSLQFPMTIVEGQRGCPHACSFCSVPAISGGRRRFRSINSLLEEIDYLTGTRGIREISFVDPDFMTNARYALAVSEGMIALKRPVSWFCNARAASVSEHVALTMRAAGCHLIYLGAESGDPAILGRIHKRQTLEQVEDACRILRASDIQVSAGFIIGFPFDTDDSISRTIEFAKRLKPAKFQFSIFNWFPGILMEVPSGSVSIGFHPKTENTRWLKWQRRAYEELGNN
jgi:anaerobic magnesium-protoporphyrin IX monomethyl ester cyclase